MKVNLIRQQDEIPIFLSGGCQKFCFQKHQAFIRDLLLFTAGMKFDVLTLFKST
jgi:hypothetical protein